MKPAISAVLALTLLGCGTHLSRNASMIRQADPPMVASCEFLGTVDGSSGWGGVKASTGMQNARNEALEKASRLGATHVVWASISGGYTPFATGQAYRCS